MVVKVCLIHCHIISLILFYALKGYIPWDMYLSEAEVTPELKDCVLAYNPEIIDYSGICAISSRELAYYLSFVKDLVRILK